MHCISMPVALSQPSRWNLESISEKGVYDGGCGSRDWQLHKNGVKTMYPI